MGLHDTLRNTLHDRKFYDRHWFKTSSNHEASMQCIASAPPAPIDGTREVIASVDCMPPFHRLCPGPKADPEAARRTVAQVAEAWFAETVAHHAAAGATTIILCFDRQADILASVHSKVEEQKLRNEAVARAASDSDKPSPSALLADEAPFDCNNYDPEDKLNLNRFRHTQEGRLARDQLITAVVRDCWLPSKGGEGAIVRNLRNTSVHTVEVFGWCADRVGVAWTRREGAEPSWGPAWGSDAHSHPEADLTVVRRALHHSTQVGESAQAVVVMDTIDSDTFALYAASRDKWPRRAHVTWLEWGSRWMLLGATLDRMVANAYSVPSTMDVWGRLEPDQRRAFFVAMVLCGTDHNKHVGITARYIPRVAQELASGMRDVALAQLLLNLIKQSIEAFDRKTAYGRRRQRAKDDPVFEVAEREARNVVRTVHYWTSPFDQ